MEVEKCLSIDELYDRVKDYDLVLTAEAPLSDSINNRLDKPFLGKFADTPKRYVRNQTAGNLMNDNELFIKVVQTLNIDWKIAKYYIDNILDCWKETGEVDKICKYDQFDNKIVKDIIDIIKDSNHIFTLMNNFKIEGDSKVAVINLYQFNEIDKKILPKNFKTIPSFTNEKKKLPEFKILGSSAEIVEVLKKNITLENCNKVGIVLDTLSKYNSLIKSALKAKGIPLREKRLINSDLDMRTFIQLIKTSLKYEVLRLKDIQPFLTHFGFNISIKHNQELLNKLTESNVLLVKFIEFMKSIEGETYKNVLKRFQEFRRQKLDHITELLKNLNYNDKKVDEDTINDLAYYIDSFKISFEGSGAGVLLASPKNVSYVDRPLVFFIGMDTTWNKNIVEKPWIDTEKFKKLQFNNFKILLQNGEKQYYLVQEKQ